MLSSSIDSGFLSSILIVVFHNLNFINLHCRFASDLSPSLNYTLMVFFALYMYFLSLCYLSYLSRFSRFMRANLLLFFSYYYFIIIKFFSFYFFRNYSLRVYTTQTVFLYVFLDHQRQSYKVKMT